MIILACALSCIQIAAAPPAPPGEQPVRIVRRGPPPPDAVTGDHADLPMESSGGLPTIAVTVNGHPLRFGFDTGAGGGVHLTAAVADALQIAPIGEGMAADPSGRNPQPIKIYKLDRLAIGGVTVEGAPASAVPGQMQRREGLDGILGLSSFAGFVVTLDYAHHRFRLDRASLPPADGKNVLDYAGWIPVLPLTIEGKSIPAHLDSGNTRFAVIVPTAFAEGLAHYGARHPIGQAHTVSNTVDMFATGIEGKAHLGTLDLAATEAGWPSVIDTANVGSLALDGVIVRIDPANHRISLAR